MNKKNRKTTSSRRLLTIDKTKDFRLVESYKTLRTNLMFSFPDADSSVCRKILVTSAGAGEGKTTTAVNLALSIAQNGAKVLLIDADMRKPTIHRYFNLESRQGLSNILSGIDERSECIFDVPSTQGFSVIPSGIIPPTPSELLGSNAMKRLLDALSSAYDYIVIDSPPIGIVTDALALSAEVDGVVFVASCGKTRMPDINKAVQTLKLAKANLLGVILNRVPNRKMNRYYKARYYYGYTDETGYDVQFGKDKK